MATFNHIVLALVILVVVLLPSTTVATQYIVGDDRGWTTNYDYTMWTNGKTFYIGDTLVFKYPQGSHNVNKVNATDFASCTVSDPGSGLTSGYDVVTLLLPGKMWYICGVANHCAQMNQKLVINVEGAMPAPAPSSATKFGFQAFMVIIVVLGLIVMF